MDRHPSENSPAVSGLRTNFFSRWQRRGRRDHLPADVAETPAEPGQCVVGNARLEELQLIQVSQIRGLAEQTGGLVVYGLMVGQRQFLQVAEARVERDRVGGFVPQIVPIEDE